MPLSVRMVHVVYLIQSILIELGNLNTWIEGWSETDALRGGVHQASST